MVCLVTMTSLLFLTLGAARVTVVVGCVLSVCLSASYLTSRAINRSTNDTTYSASDECRQICGVSLKLELQRETRAIKPLC